MTPFAPLHHLSVKQKAKYLLFVLAAISSVLLGGLLSIGLLRWTDMQERQKLQNSLGQIQSSLKERQSQLGLLTNDWGVWDEANTFVTGQNPDFFEENVDWTGIQRLQLNLLAYFDLKGNPVGVRWKTSEQRQNQFPAFWPPLAQQLRLGVGTRLDTMVQTPDGLLLLAIRPVTNNASTRVGGSLLMGRLLTITTLQANPDMQVSLRVYVSTDRLGIYPLSNQIVTGRLLLKQPQDLAPLLLSVKLQRHLYQQALWIVLGVCAALMLLAYFFSVIGLHLFDRVLLLRIRNIQRSINQIETGSQLSPPTLQGYDELDALSSALQDMVGRLDQNQAESLIRQEILRQIAEGCPLDQIAAQVLRLASLQLGGGWASLELQLQEHQLLLDLPLKYSLHQPELGLIVESSAGEVYGTLRVSVVPPLPLDSLQQTADLLAMAAEQSVLRHQLREQARRDPLTSLLDRRGLTEQLELDIAAGPVAVLQLNLDRFKRLNETVGHSAGDELLRVMARRLQWVLAPQMYAARLYSDKFAVVLPGGDAVQAWAQAGKLLSHLSGPVDLGNYTLQVSVRLGMAMSPDHSRSAAELLRFADLAIPNPDAHTRIAVFDLSMAEEASERLQLENDFRHAFERSELHVAYQPQVDLRLGKVVGVEALARWTHPVRGEVSPLRFIGLAEESGLIVELGHWVLQTACQQLAQWHTEGLKLKLSVNVSARQFATGTLVGQVQEVLYNTQLSASDLTLEVTESLLMPDASYAQQQLHALAALGIHLSIDDFGTGYSSLSYLSRMPIHSLKIDRSFVRDLPRRTGSSALTHTLINMAHQLGLAVVAEGIETQAQAELLCEWNCDWGQGFLYAKPLAPQEVWAAAHSLGASEQPSVNVLKPLAELPSSAASSSQLTPEQR